MSEYINEMLKKKYEACEMLIPEVSSAWHMKRVFYENDENNKLLRIEEHMGVPEGLKEEMVSYLEEFSTNENLTHVIFSEGDFCAYLRLYDNEIKLVTELDMGTKHHTYYNGAEEMLYGLYCLKVIKEKKPVKKLKPNN